MAPINAGDAAAFDGPLAELLEGLKRLVDRRLGGSNGRKAHVLSDGSPPSSPLIHLKLVPPLFRRLIPLLRPPVPGALKVRAQTGHASDAILARYVRDGELFTDNAASAML